MPLHAAFFGEVVSAIQGYMTRGVIAVETCSAIQHFRHLIPLFRIILNFALDPHN